MQKKEFDLLLTRARRWAGRLEHAWLETPQPLAAVCAVTPDRLPFAEGTGLPGKPVRVGDLWNDGKAWVSGWFKLSGRLPEERAGRPVFVRLNFGGEILVFDAAGKVRAGLTNQSAFAHWYNKEYHEITDLIRPDGSFEFWAEAAANHLGGVDARDGIATPGHAGERGYYHADIARLEFGFGNSQLRQLHLDLQFLVSLVEAGAESPDPRRRQIVRILSNAADQYLDNPANAGKARAVLKELFERPAAASSLKTTAVGHAHIDTGWLWPVAESVRKTARTFASQLELIRQYPDYVFGASAPQHFLFLKEYYPELYAEVKKAVAAGRIEPQGGMWVEADCNLTGGEAMVRQFVHGKNFFRDEFGFEVKNLWIPDVFGYSAAMPQIIRKANCDYFLTQKISWNQVNRFPHHTFLWRGIDGTEVLTHFPPEDTYNSECSPKGLIGAEQRFIENDFVDEFMTLFGVGDGGGGPKMEVVENALRARNMDGVPQVRMGRACDFFERISRFRGQLAVWSGELYLELHRGTLTTQSRTKRGNRKCEQALRLVEGVYAALPFGEYPAKELDALWKKLLINQFHDILPGSSIELVYERTEREHAEILAACRELLNRAARIGLQPDPAHIVLTNVLSVPYRRSIELPESWRGCAVVRADGAPVTVQQEAGRTVIATEIPAWSSVELVRGGQLSAAAELRESLVLENALVRYEFDADGRLLRARDLETGRELLEGVGNELTLYVDRPNNWDAWDVDFFYEQEKIETARGLGHRRIADGPVRQGLEFQLAIGASKLVQKVYLEANSRRLEFRTEADWHEANRMLRVSFPVTVRAAEAAFDIQYGYVRRPTHRNTSWDQARFETVAHRYVDLSTEDGGVALLNDCKYGHKVHENVLDLNLLRSPQHPDPYADQGRHEFTYALLPHAGNLVASEVQAEAAALNLPPFLAEGFSGGFRQPFAVTADGVSLEVAKKAEKDSDLVLRLVETRGREGAAELRFEQPVTAAETDLLEWNTLAELGTGSLFQLSFKPFEIKTVKVRCAAGI